MIFEHNYPWQLMHQTQECVQWVIEQELISQCKPITFFLTKLLPTQRKYSTFSWELQAIYLLIKHFWHFLEGRNFTIYTNHKLLTTTMSTSFDKYTSHKIWNLKYLSQFSTDIWHVKGKDNAVADMLSWTGIHSLETNEQKSNSALQDVLMNTSLKLQKFPAFFRNDTLYCNVSLANPRPYILPKLWKQVFQHLHRLLYPSKRAMVKHIADHFVWLNMNADIREWVLTCLECQKYKIY